VAEYLVFMLAFAASAAAPGPETAALVSRSLSGGLRTSLWLAAGIILGKLLMLTAAIVGVAALLRAIGPLFVLLKFAGAAYLVWLGIRKWRAAGRMLKDSEQMQAGSIGAEVGVGLAMTLSNPLALAFYIALLPGTIDVAGITMASYAVLCLILVAVMAVIVLAYGGLAEIARKLFASSQARANVERASGTMMLGAGVAIATR
jgi:threonine/homoserine/homoserine lactone efflux protein